MLNYLSLRVFTVPAITIGDMKAISLAFIEANYGPNIDIYNGEAPFGFEMEGKKAIKGLKLAFGPELWWGANPAILAKYSRTIAKFNVTGMFHEDLTQRSGLQSSFAVPTPKTRKAALSVLKIRKIWNYKL